MAGSSFGHTFRLSTFGESHGVAIGGVIDGVPAGEPISLEFIQNELNKRRPGQSDIVTQRNEADKVELLSGIIDGKTSGAPIGFIIRNKDQKPKDYDHLKDAYRPSHADFTYDKKYGVRDARGGGRSSARETACRVVGGAIAKQILYNQGIKICAYVDQIGNVKVGDIDLSEIENNVVRCPNSKSAEEMMDLINLTKEQGDTVGGGISCTLSGVPSGLGEPVFDKLHAELGKAVLSINAVKGIEFGSGFDAIEMNGSLHNDTFEPDGSTKTNYSGGVQGGISNGMPINFRVAFKPVSTLLRDQETINSSGERVVVEGKGRHDACVVPRAVVIVESMAAMVLLDMFLRNRTTRLN